MKLEHLESTAHRPPLSTPTQAASTGVTHDFDLVRVRPRDCDGAAGCGCTVLFAGQRLAVSTIVASGTGT